MVQYIQNKVTERADGVVEIHIRRRDGSRYVALIDADDFSKISRYRRWGVAPGRVNRNYVSTTLQPSKQKLLLHRIVLGRVPKGKEVSFRNGNPFDCRKSNLVVTNHADLCRQLLKIPISVTGERYIYPDNYGYGYNVQISIGGGKRYRKHLQTLHKAIKCRNAKLKELGITIDAKGMKLIAA